MDISRGGVRISAPEIEDFAGARHLEMKFIWAQRSDGVCCYGRVCWSLEARGEDGPPCEAGIEFRRFSDQDKLELLRFILRKLQPLVEG